MGAAVATRVVLAYHSLSMATTGAWASTACTQRESMQRVCSHTMACYPMGLGACRGAAACPASSQMGWCPVRRDGESPHGVHALHPVVSTPSRLLSLLRCAAHPLWLPSMGIGRPTGYLHLCHSPLLACMQPLYSPTAWGVSRVLY